jgi:hypothetical protein
MIDKIRCLGLFVDAEEPEGCATIIHGLRGTK